MCEVACVSEGLPDLTGSLASRVQTATVRVLVSSIHGRILLILVETHLVYSATHPSDLLLQIEAAEDATQVGRNTAFVLDPDVQTRIIAGEEQVGQRRWIRVGERFECRYRTEVQINRPDVDLSALAFTPPSLCPQDVTKFLMSSRYCHLEDFLSIVPQQFGGLSGGRRIAAMSDWIRDTFTYDNGASHAATTATQSFQARAGVCRDYAHVLIAMARAASIPARYVSAYAPDVTPQDFHAAVEVFLEDAWHLVDPTGMAKPSETVRIGVGRDAADVSFMTSYGWMELIKQTVAVSRLD